MIRPATPEDSALVSSLGVAAGMFPADDTTVTDRMMADYFAVQRDRGHMCLIDEDPEPVAMAYCEPARATDGTWYLTMIAVRPDRQGQGRGAALMHHIEGTLRERGQRILLVETSGDPGFARTRAFYAMCGYEEAARVRDYYTTGDDLVLFRKAVSAG